MNMGLNQYAGFPETLSERAIFYWRKHARLQVFFAKELARGSGKVLFQRPCQECDLCSRTCVYLGFNANEGGVKITQDIVDRLDEEIRTGYASCVAEGGFFWGQQWQKDAVIHYKVQDEKFVNWCRDQLQEGKDIAYDCSW